MNNSSSSSSKLFTVLHWRKFFSSDEMLIAHRCSVDDLTVEYDDEHLKIVASMQGKVSSEGVEYSTSIERFPNMQNMDFSSSNFKCSCNHSESSKKFCPHVAALLLKYERVNGVITIRENEEQYSERLKQQQIQRVLDKINKERGVTFDIHCIAEFNIFSSHTYPDGDDVINFPRLIKKFVSLPTTENRVREILNYGAMELENTEYMVDDSNRVCIASDVTFYDLFEKKHSFRILLNSDSVVWENENCKDLDPQVAVPVEVPYPNFRWVDKTFVNEYQIAAIELLWRWYSSNSYSEIKASLLGVRFVDKMQSAIEKERYDWYVKNSELNFLFNDAQDNKKTKVSLLPKIILNCTSENEKISLFLSFNILTDAGKKIPLYDPIQFVTKFENEGCMYFPRNQVVDFSRSVPDERTMRYMTLIGRVGNGAMEFMKYLTDFHKQIFTISSSGRNYEDFAGFFERILLNGNNLDYFYDTAVNSNVEFSTDSENFARDKTGSFRVGGSEELVLEFSLNRQTKRNGRKTLMYVEFSGYMPVILKGEGANRYLLTRNSLVRKNADEIATLEKLVNAIPAVGDFSLTFSETGSYEFFYHIYPAIIADPLFHISTDISSDDIEKIAGVNGLFTFFLDVLERTRKSLTISLKCEITYGSLKYYLGDETRDDIYTGNRTYENRVIRVIEEQCGGVKTDGAMWKWDLDPSKDLEDFLTVKLECFHVFGQVNGSAEFNRLRTRRRVSLDFDIVKSQNLLDLRLTSSNVDVNELNDIFQSYRENKKWYRLSSGEYVSLFDDPGLNQAFSLLEKLDILPADAIFNGAKIPVFRSLYLDRLINARDEIVFSKDRDFDALISRFADVRNADYPVPAGLDGIMREYQTYGFKWLKTMLHSGFGAVLADDMGLGKTLQMISLIWSEIEDRKKSEADGQNNFLALVVSPSSLVYQWIQEFNRFAPDVRVFPMVGNVASRQRLRDKSSDTDVFVISYELLVKDVPFLREMNFSLVVLDEAQKIKNYKSLTAKSVKLLNSDYRVAMTGTPIENRLAELWSIFDFIMPSYLYSVEDFTHDFEYPIAMLEDKNVADNLKNMVSPFILRRRKADVLKELPEKIEDVVYAEIDGEQQKLYDAQVLNLKRILNSSSQKNFDTFVVLSELLRMRQLCCHPSLVYPGYSKNSAKTDICIELVESAMEAGHRMLIFSQFTSMLSIIEKELNDRHISYYIITGSTPKEKRIQLVEQFNGDSTPVFLISLKAGGTGLNLTGADTVIHYDPWWNLAAQNQATDRAYRMGQKRNVTVYRLILKGTIEEKIMKLQEGKKDLADSILEGEQKSLMNMSREELLSILS
jgi:superfamily II DNA or RNA helicase